MMSCKLHLVLLTLVLTSFTYVLATSTARPHRYASTIHANTSLMIADYSIEEYGGDVKITTAGSVEVIPDNGILQFEVCANEKCIGQNHVCFTAVGAIPPLAKSVCSDFDSGCGYYVKMTDTEFWLMETDGVGTEKGKECVSVAMKYPWNKVYDFHLPSCYPKIEADGSVKLFVKEASSSCPLIVKSAKIKREVTSTAEHSENLGITPESSEGMADWLIAVIVICSIAGVCLIIAAIVYLYFKFIKKSGSQPATSSTTKKTTDHQAEGQHTEKPQGPENVQQKEVVEKKAEVAVVQPALKLEEVPNKKVDVTEKTAVEDIVATTPAEPVAVKEVPKIPKAADAKPEIKQPAPQPAAVVDPKPEVKKQDGPLQPAAVVDKPADGYVPDYHGTRSPFTFCRRLKSKSGRSFNKKDSMREVARKNYGYLLDVHIRSLAKHDPWFDEATVRAVMKKYPSSAKLLDREVDLILNKNPDAMVEELVIMGRDAEKLLVEAELQLDDEKKLKKISRGARNLVADRETPEYVKHYMFALEFNHRIPQDIGTLEALSFSLLFVVAICPFYTYELRRLAAALIKSTMPLLGEHWDPPELACAPFPVNAAFAAEKRKADALIAAGREKEQAKKKEKVKVETTTQETNETTADKNSKETKTRDHE